MVLVALFMGSQMAIFAQGKKEGKTDRKQFGQEQMQKMQCNQLINALALMMRRLLSLNLYTPNIWKKCVLSAI